MLIWLSQQLSLGSFEKITFRASLAGICGFALALWLGPRLIAWLKARFREPNISASDKLEALHEHKQWTPTMGGMFIVGGVVMAVLLFADLTNPYLLSALILLLGLTGLGAWDDLQKLSQQRGIRPRTKLLFQTIIATVVASMIYYYHADLPGGLDLRFAGWTSSYSLGGWFIPLAVLVIVGSSNAVNITDGLDGLACGCLLFTVAALGALTYASGHAELAAYLGSLRVPGAGELTVLVGAIMGGILGFLWFNCHPAQVFMGDTGSLPLGGMLGFLAIVSRQELLLLVLGGVYVAEILSVVIQVTSYKWRRRRVFLCAPLHHHFQFLGWSENKIVVRFWIASALCALVGMVAMRFSVQDDSAPQRATSPYQTIETHQAIHQFEQESSRR